MNPDLKTWPHQFKVLLRFTLMRTGFFWRGLLCFVLGCILVLNDESTSYDRRFQVRGEQRLQPKIVIVTVDKTDLSFSPKLANNFTDLREIFETTDSFYWDPKLWEELLTRILDQKPQKVGVTLFFPDSLNAPNLSSERESVLQDPRVIWAAISTQMDRAILPLLANYIKSNVGTLDLTRDEDGLVRRYISPRGEMNHFVEKLVDHKVPSQIINYRGIENAVIEVSAADVLNRMVAADFFEDKIVIIGGEFSASSGYLTPFGITSRQIVVAQIVDNAIAKRWINRLPLPIYFLGLLLLLLAVVHVVSRFPQTASAFILLWIITLITSLSIWVFDNFYVWIPILSPIVQTMATWILFLGYQANRIERKNFELQQQQKNALELEQLKNNFVSLISHDLKTPIAKIQAVVDRLLSEPQNEIIKQDLILLRNSGEELNRYIQSILKLLRIESKDFKINLDVCDLNQMIEDVLLQLKPLAREKNIQIKAELEPLFSLELDPTLIREVILNLVDNAIKYTRSGGLVRISTYEEDSSVYVEVTDTGSGISQEEIPSIWGKFVRGKDQNLKTKGSGLGLYLVKYFIELHGGAVKIDSELGIGTTIRFSLPVESVSFDKGGT